MGLQKRITAGVFLTLALLSANVKGADFEVKVPELFEADTIFWTAPDGNDAAAGTESAPFATIKRAAEAAAEARRTNPEKSVCVYFKAGEYRMTEPITIESLAGTPEKPVLFRSAPGAKGKCVFTGSKNVSGWEPLKSSRFWETAPEQLKSRIRPESAEKIWTAPYAQVETTLYAPEKYGERQEFFVNGTPQTLARWPNSGFAVSGQALGETRVTSWAADGSKEGIFEADENQPAGWNQEKGASLFGYWFWDWADSYVKLDSIDEVQEGRFRIKTKEPYSWYGYRNNLRYYGFNLLCELDAPGEFYVDRGLKQIFWIPGEGIDPKSADTRFNLYEQPWYIIVSNSSDLLFAGLSFEGGFGGLFNISKSDRVILADLDIRRFSGDVVVSIEGGTGCGGYGVTLDTIGGGGFVIKGGDRPTLTDARHFLSNCTFHSFSRIHRTYAPAALINGCGIKTEHCDFSDASSSAIRMEGNENRFEYCTFHEVVTESDDQGGIDVFYDPSYRGNVIRYNYWKNIKGGKLCGAAAVRFDDMISGFLVYGNVFENCGGSNFGAVQIHGGKDNIIKNNVFLGCIAAASFTKWDERYLDAFNNKDSKDYSAIHNKCYEVVNIDSPLWVERYPELARIKQDPNVNQVHDNLVINCTKLFIHDDGVEQTENNTVETRENVNLAEILAPESLAKYGLQPIPFDEMGVTGKPYLSE